MYSQFWMTISYANGYVSNFGLLRVLSPFLTSDTNNPLLLRSSLAQLCSLLSPPLERLISDPSLSMR